jgi:crotonobetainyl-CoA:carnitine CoA-transferase CaiB-like acyl-CoA transferase
MSHILQPLNERTNALAAFAQPVIVALSTAGITGGMMAAAGMLAGRLMSRQPSSLR